MTDEHIPQNTGMDTMPEGPAEPQPLQNAPAAEPAFPLGPRDSIKRLLGAYILISLATVIYMEYATAPMVAAEYSFDLVNKAQNAFTILATLLVCRVFFGPLVPRIREVWGHTWVPIPSGILVTGGILFFLFALKSFGSGYHADQGISLLEVPVLVLFALGNVASLILVDYGVVYRLFVRFPMRTALPALVLISFLFSGFMMAIYFNNSMPRIGWQIHWLVLSLARTAWELYTYKRLKTLAPLVLMDAGLAVMYIFGRIIALI